MTTTWNQDPLAPDAFEAHRLRPFEFSWVRVGEPGNYDYVYQRKTTQKVVAARSTGVSRRGGGARSTSTGLAAMVLPCSACASSHSPVNPCQT